jgi:hypothetical protein
VQVHYVLPAELLEQCSMLLIVCSLEDIGMHSVSFDRRVIMLGDACNFE